MTRSLLPWIIAAIAGALAACIENRNDIGVINVGGGVLDLGGRGGGGGAGSGSGGTPGDTALVVTCTDTLRQLSLSRVCDSPDDCVPVSEPSNVTFPNPVLPECSTFYFAIQAAELTRLEAFSLACRERAKACPPNQRRIVTEDGKSGSYDVSPAATCSDGVCRSYQP
jgi:hypothetical protein